MNGIRKIAMCLMAFVLSVGLCPGLADADYSEGVAAQAAPMDLSTFKFIDCPDRVSVIDVDIDEFPCASEWAIVGAYPGSDGRPWTMVDYDTQGVHVAYYSQGAPNTELSGRPSAVGDYIVGVSMPGNGDYAGEARHAFAIMDAPSLSEAHIFESHGPYCRRNEAYPVTVGYGDRTLEEGTDYVSVLRRWSDDAYFATGMGWVDVPSADEVGARYSCVISGIGDFAGRVTNRFEVVEDNDIRLAETVYSYKQGASDVEYQPEIDVSLDGVALVNGKDYSLTYEYYGQDGDGAEVVNGLSSPGLYNITLTGIGRFTGGQQFVLDCVAPIDISGCSIVGYKKVVNLVEDEPFWFDGVALAIVDEDGDSVDAVFGLGAGTNGSVAFYKDGSLEPVGYPTEPGEYKVIVEGRGRYTGRVEAAFTVVGRSGEGRAITDEGGVTYRCSTIDFQSSGGVYLYSPVSGLAEGGLYKDGSQTWYNADAGCAVAVRGDSAAYKAELVSYTVGDGSTIVPDLDWGFDSLGAYATFLIPADSGPVSVFAQGTAASTVANGVMTFEDPNQPNAYLLQFDLPEGVTLGGVLYGAGASRDIVMIPRDDERYSGRGIPSDYLSAAEYYFWPDSANALMFNVAAGVDIAVAELISNGSGNPGKANGWQINNGENYGVSISLTEPATLKLVTATGMSPVEASVSEPISEPVVKKANPMKVTAKAQTVNAKKLKKKARVIVAKKAFKVTGARGRVSYKQLSGNKISVTATGKVTIKKGLKKGSYKAKVKVSTAGDANYGPKSVTVTLKVKVR